MNASVAMTPLGSALRAWRDPLASARAADVAAVLIACPVVVHVARRDLRLAETADLPAAAVRTFGDGTLWWDGRGARILRDIAQDKIAGAADSR
jgi:hypothetical protein